MYHNSSTYSHITFLVGDTNLLLWSSLLRWPLITLHTNVVNYIKPVNPKGIIISLFLYVDNGIHTKQPSYEKGCGLKSLVTKVAAKIRLLPLSSQLFTKTSLRLHHFFHSLAAFVWISFLPVLYLVLKSARVRTLALGFVFTWSTDTIMLIEELHCMFYLSIC